MNEPKLERCHIGPWDEVLLDGHGRKCVAILKQRITELEKENAKLRRAPLPDNKALTVEELREMDGQPVWIVAHPDWGHWELSECAEDYFEDRDEDFYGMTMPPKLPDPMGRYGLHMLGWLAYRRPPEKE